MTLAVSATTTLSSTTAAPSAPSGRRTQKSLIAAQKRPLSPASGTSAATSIGLTAIFGPPEVDEEGPAARRRRATTEAYATYAAGRSEEPTTRMGLHRQPPL